MNTRHTSGRLAVTHNNWEISTLCCGGQEIALVRIDSEVDEETQQHFQSIKEANAKRLAACWNACDGVPIEVLETQQSGGLPWQVADQIERRVQFNAYKEGSEEAFGDIVEQKRKAEERASRIERTIQEQQCVIVNMRAQRDELLALLRIVRGKHGCGALTLPRADVERIDAAIAKAGGAA